MKAADLVASFGPRQWSSRRIAWSGGLFIAMIIALALFDIMRSYRTTVEGTERELESQARVLAEQTARSMQAVDVVLGQLVEQFESGKLAALSPQELHVYLAEKAVGLVQVDALAVFGIDGSVRAVSAMPPDQMPALNVAGFGAFDQVRASNGRRALVIDKPALNPANGAWIFPMGRPLRTRDGAFAGAVGAPGRIDYFQQFYRAAYPDAATRIALIHSNATLLARHPPADALLGQRLPVVAGLLADAASGQAFSRGTSPVDGIDRFASVHAVPDYPLAIVVTRDAAAALAPWRRQALGSAARTLALALLATLLIAVVMRQVARLNAARDSLEDSRERYALAAAGSDDGIWDWDLVTRTAYESARARELQGLPPGPETQPLDELQRQLTYHPDDAALRTDTMQAHLDGKTAAYEVEYRVRHPDGQYRWIRVRALCIRAADGTPLRIAGSVSDVDARKRAEVALRESEERFALAVAGSDDGIWDINYVTGQAFYSVRGRQIVGLADDEVLTADNWEETIRERIHPDDRARRHAAIISHLTGRAPASEVEYRVRRPDGGWRWVRVRGVGVRNADGMPLRIAGSVSDIDVRKRAEEALRVSEERYALAMTGSHEGHWVWDMAERQVFVSATLAEMFGLPGGAQTMRDEDYFAAIPLHPADHDRVHRNRERHFRGETPRLDHEFRILLPATGEVRWLHTRGQCFRDAEGRPERMAGATVDVTERHATLAALKASEERFALAVAGSDDGIWDWNYETDTAYISPRGREINGMGPAGEDQSIATCFEQVGERLHPDDRERRRIAIGDHLAGRTPAYLGEYRVRSETGGYRWIRIRGVCVRDADGRPLRMAGSVSDIDAERRAKDELRESEERYALAMTGSRGGHWVWDADTDELFVSGTLNELFGLPVETHATTRSAYFANVTLHPDDAGRIDALGDDLLAGRAQRADFEYRIVLRDGTPRWILTRAQAFRSGERGLRIAGVSVDISERKRTEDALRESEERFALAVEGSNDGIVDWDIVNDRLFISARALQILGIASDTLVRPSAEWSAMLPIHPDDRMQHDEDFRQVIVRQTGARSGDYRMRQPDGTWRWVRVRGTTVRSAAGRAIRWAGSVTDIDVQKRTEDALRRSEERYQLAVEGSNEGLWDWDLATDLLFLSPRAQRLTFLEPGEPLRPRDEWIARTTYHPDDLGEVRRAIAEHLRGATPHFAVEYRLQHHSGVWHWYRQRGVALRDANGKPYRMAGSMEDISLRKNAEAERDRLELQLRQAQKLEAIGTLAGGIAHDFNNILAAILGYGELAQKDAPEGTPLRRHVDAALSAGQRAKSLVERILAFSRSGMGERVPVHVQAVVGEALDVVAASMPAGVKLDAKLAAGDAGILGDPVQLHQVVLNLCANAVQAMRSEGVLTVATEVVALDAPLAVATSTLPAGRYVRLVVADTGTGIAPHLLERIFDPFFTTKEVGVGTGLGLSLVHGIVTDLGGGIAVESRVGEGAVFTVWLPWQSYAAAPVALADEAVAAGNGETVLLVDDEEALVRLGEERLAELGYEPVGFASSVAALEAFRAEPDRFDVLLSDEAMPGLTGTELIAEIRRLRPELPVVLMSGYVTPALSARARALGVLEVLGKPLVAADIARSLAAALGRRLHRTEG